MTNRNKRQPPRRAKKVKDKKKDSYLEDKKSSKWMLAVKILWLPLVLLVVLLISLIIGHTMIGDQPASDIFNIDMWIHLLKLILQNRTRF